ARRGLEAAARGAVLPAERQRGDELGRIGAPIRHPQEIHEELHRRALVARQTRAVVDRQGIDREAAGSEQLAQRGEAIGARARRTGSLGAERVDELARHDVVAVLVDAADDLAERPRAPHERRRGVGRNLALAKLPAERATYLVPERREQAEREGVVLEHRATE